MRVFDLFSKRQRRARGEVSDVFVYDDVPPDLRVKIIHICRDAFGDENMINERTAKLYMNIYNILCREYGVFSLTEIKYRSHSEGLFHFFLESEETEKVLDIIELVFWVIDSNCRHPGHQFEAAPRISPDDAIQELNHRLIEHGIGYQYESGKLIRKDSEFIHQEVVKPTLALLAAPLFESAHDEFLKAHEHYRHGLYKECLNECLKALESTIKIICKKRKWGYKETDTAKSLLEVCFVNNLIPNFLQAHFAGLRATLEAGIPSARNKLSGHGQGPEQTQVPAYFAEYILNLTATTIVLLVRAEQAL